MEKSRINKLTVITIALVSLMAIASVSMLTTKTLTASSTPIPTTQTTQYPWPMIGHDNTMTSLSPGPGPKTNHLLWKINLGAEVNAPIVWKGRVFVRSNSAVLYCLDAITGEILWSQRPTEGPDVGASTMTILQPMDNWGAYQQHDLIVVGHATFVKDGIIKYPGGIFAYDTITGELDWAYRDPPAGTAASEGYIIGRNPSPIAYTQFLYPTGRSHVVVQSRYITSFTQEGIVEWSVGTGGRGFNRTSQEYVYCEDETLGCDCNTVTIYPGPDGKGLLLTPGADHGETPLTALNATTGEVVWWRLVNSTSCNNAAFYDGKLYWGAPTRQLPGETNPAGTALPGFIECTDAYTGEELWRWTQEDAGYAPATPSAQLVVYDDKIYTGDYAGGIYCIDAQTGKTIWNRQEVGAMAGRANGPIIAGGIVYCGGAPWRVYGKATSYALDAMTGETIWSYDTTGAQKHQGAVADGIWYVPTGDGWLYAFGQGSTETTLNLSTAQLKAGDTILISGMLLDQSKANPDLPVANEPITLFSLPLGGADITDISTVTTGTYGDYYTEWIVPEDLEGMYSVVARYSGSDSYDLSTGQVNIRIGPPGFSTEEMQQITDASTDITADEVASKVIDQLTAPQDYTTMFYAVIALIVIAVGISVYSAFIKKRK